MEADIVIAAEDVFSVDLGSSQSAALINDDINDTNRSKVNSESKEETEQEDYMELYVAKELKDKIEPIEESLIERKEEFDKLFKQVSDLEIQIQTVDRHYNGVSRAMLTKQGIMLQEVDELNILKEYGRIAEKEARRKERLKREQSSISPQPREGSPQGREIDTATDYVKKLHVIA